MRFIARTITDRLVQFQNRYKAKDPTTGAVIATYDFERETGNITDEGTRIAKSYLQPLENAVQDAYYAHGGLPIEAAKIKRIDSNTFDETIGGKLYRKTVLIRQNGVVTGANVKIYADNGIDIIKEYTDSITRVSGVFSELERGVAK